MAFYTEKSASICTKVIIFFLSTEPSGLLQDLSISKKTESFEVHLKMVHKLISMNSSHALVGYWAGIHLSSKPMKKYNVKIEYPRQSPDNVANIRDIAMDSLEKYGVGWGLLT